MEKSHMDAKYNQLVDQPAVRIALQCPGFVTWIAVVYALMSAAIL
jgi:hypothetical protein